ncbi:MAG TPA: nucleoside monophosphate kinase [Acidimicrobiia bacterium]|jgi:adenylate kinase|nr:nucleoside monophosphate kinase [Acidimicrobiia bacterium]
MSSAVFDASVPSRPDARTVTSASPPLVVLAGPPGSGKGTQCSRLVDRHGLAHVSIGECLRQEVEAGTSLGVRVRASLEAGRLVPDDDVSEVVSERLARHRAASAILLDGFPRTVGQAQMLEQLRPSAVGLVVLLVVPLTTVLKRLSGRRRADDADPDAVAARLLAYEHQTRPVLDWYASLGLLVHVDASAAPRAVTDRIARHLSAFGLCSPPGSGRRSRGG